MQRFLDPDGLKARGIEHFDAWAATFGEVVESMEISPDGKTLKFPLPLLEVRQPAGAPADVPGLRRRPDRRDAGPAKAQAGRRQASCVVSPARCPTSKPRSSRNWWSGMSASATAASIPAWTTSLHHHRAPDGRKLALDARMLSAEARAASPSKLEAMLDHTAEQVAAECRPPLHAR